MKQKPKIGITMRLELETRRFYLGRDYAEALVYFGAIPVHLGLIPAESYISEAIQNLDGILLPGSDTDVDPKYFGESPHPKIKTIIREKEETDFLSLKYAEKQNISVLGICFGMQILNVARGGSLFQDIEAQIENPIKHQQGIPLDRNSHSITLDENSRLAQLTKEAGIDKNQIRVNSHHHQAIKNVGNGLKATAWASDDVVECIEDISENKFVLGVQWHPELSYKTDKLSEQIFVRFIESCKK